MLRYYVACAVDVAAFAGAPVRSADGDAGDCDGARGLGDVARIYRFVC